MEHVDLVTIMERAKRPCELDDYKFSARKYCGVDNFNGINLSGLFSYLIKEAGRLCDCYASDMYYDLKMLERHLYEDMKFVDEPYCTMLGIRSGGVDHMEWVASHIEDKSCQRTYREIIYIKVDRTDADYADDEYVLSVYTLDPWTLEYTANRLKEVK